MMKKALYISSNYCGDSTESPHRNGEKYMNKTFNIIVPVLFSSISVLKALNNDHINNLWCILELVHIGGGVYL